MSDWGWLMLWRPVFSTSELKWITAVAEDIQARFGPAEWILSCAEVTPALLEKRTVLSEGTEAGRVSGTMIYICREGAEEIPKPVYLLMLRSVLDAAEELHSPVSAVIVVSWENQAAGVKARRRIDVCRFPRV